MDLPCNQNQNLTDHCWAICGNFEDFGRHVLGIDDVYWNELYDAMRCKRPRYSDSSHHFPGMCKEHGESYGLTDLYKTEKPKVKTLIDFLCKPIDENSIFIFEFLTTKEDGLDTLMRIIFSPMGIMSMNPFYMYVALKLRIQLFAAELDQPEDLAVNSYIFLVPYIYNLLPWLMQGQSKYDPDPLIMTKWNCLAQKLSKLFIVPFTQQDNIDLPLPLLSPNWKHEWTQLFEKELRKKNPGYDTKFVKLLFQQLAFSIEVARNVMVEAFKENAKKGESGG